MDIKSYYDPSFEELEVIVSRKLKDDVSIKDSVVYSQINESVIDEIKSKNNSFVEEEIEDEEEVKLRKQEEWRKKEEEIKKQQKEAEEIKKMAEAMKQENLK